MKSINIPLCVLLLLAVGCRDLWSGFGQPNPHNCALFPSACTMEERCNLYTEVCEPWLSFDQITPSQGSSSGGIPLTLSGYGFSAESVVTFGDSVASTSELISGTELRVSLPALAGACGGISVKVARPDGLSVTREDLFSYSLANVRFMPAQPATTDPSGFAAYLAAADLDADGKSDLAAAAYDDDGVILMFGNGDGSFTRLPSIKTGLQPFHIDIGDLNGDGIFDLAVANTGAGTVSLLYGLGGRRFESTVDLANVAAMSVQILDADGNGLADLAVYTKDGKLRLWRGDGAGNFSFQGEQILHAAGGSGNYPGKADA